MTGWRSAAGFLLAASVVLLCPGPAAGVVATERLEHRTLFRFADASIAESSGLVDAGSVVYTTNDSGAGPVLYAVDPRTGQTTGTTTYSSSEVTDVEALAPAPGGDVWVADIGDNAAARASVALYRVRPGAGDAPRVELTYPGGPRDAETLLVHPVTGRAFVVSKTVFGGVVYAVPSLAPGGPHRLRRFAQEPGLVTDGAFFPDGRHVLLRGYGAATVYTFPGFAPRGTVVLPPQRQGEGVAIGADGRILLSSEGTHAPVLEVTLPPALAAEVGAPGPQASPSPPPDSGQSPAAELSAAGDPSRAAGPAEPDEPAEAAESGPSPGWIVGGAALLAVLAGLVWATRRRS
jgi:hypothetical protein